MWELDYKENWAPQNWYFWTVVLEKTLESPLDCKEIQPVRLKGDQSWMFIGRNDVEAETPILWPPDAKSWLIGKDPAAGKDWGQEEKGTTEDEMVGWHHLLSGHRFGWTPGVGDGQGGLVCCSSWGHKESDTTEQLNWTVTNHKVFNIISWEWFDKDKFPGSLWIAYLLKSKIIMTVALQFLCLRIYYLENRRDLVFWVPYFFQKQGYTYVCVVSRLWLKHFIIIVFK